MSQTLDEQVKNYLHQDRLVLPGDATKLSMCQFCGGLVPRGDIYTGRAQDVICEDCLKKNEGLAFVMCRKCGKVHGEDYIPYMMEKGYSGIIVTDHFFNGNTCVPSDISWEERVEIYCSGYERALKAAEGVDFNVMFGVEFNFNKDEYLLYAFQAFEDETLPEDERLIEEPRTYEELIEQIENFKVWYK